MKRILTTIQEMIQKVILITVLAGAMVSCDSVLGFDDGDCSIEYRVKFKYDWNMDKVDRFSEQVRTVTLYAFDDQGNLVFQKTDEGEMLADGSYTMNLDINPGNYHLIAWAGLNDQSFAIPVLMLDQSNIEELIVKTLRNNSTGMRASDTERDQFIVESELRSLWHGEVKVTGITRSGNTETSEVSLIKNTNHIRVNIAQVNQNPNQPVTRVIQKSDLKFAIYDDNGLMNYDNSLLSDNLLTYRPYNTDDGTVESTAFTRAPAQYKAAIADLSVGRLIEDKIPQLNIISNITGEKLISDLDLVKYFDETRKLYNEKYNDNMSLQEYLDREDEYEITLFVNETMALINTVIQINGWIININDIEL